MFFINKNKDKNLLIQIENNLFDIMESILNTYKMILFNKNNDKILFLLNKYLPSIIDEELLNPIKDNYAYSIHFDLNNKIQIYKDHKKIFNILIGNDGISLYIKIIKNNIDFYHIYKLYIKSDQIHTGGDFTSLQDKINILNILYNIIDNMVEIVREISRLEKLDKVIPDQSMIDDLSKLLNEFSNKE